MVLRRKVSKQESGDESFAVIRGGFDFVLFFKWRVLMPRVCSSNSMNRQALTVQ